MSGAGAWTPGPWKVRFTDEDNPCPFVCTEGDVICLPDANHEQPDPSDVANARLIATAPGLYEILVKIVEVLILAHPALASQQIIIDARAILAKARGEQP